MRWSEGKQCIQNLPFMSQSIYVIILNKPLRVFIISGVSITMSFGDKMEASLRCPDGIYSDQITD